MASAHQQPFFVAPKERISTPRFQVISAGVVSSAVSALAKRAPSICNGTPALLANFGNRRDLVEFVDRALLGGLRHRHQHRLALVNGARRKAIEAAFRFFGTILPFGPATGISREALEK